jgi:hypothetical protein
LILLLASIPTAAAPPALPDALPDALPEGVSPLPPESAGRLRELLQAAEKYRGLTARRPVPSGVLGEEELKKKVVEAFREEVPPEVLRSLEASLKAFGLIPETMDLARFYPELLTSQVAGFYDPERDYLALVRREGGFLGPAADAGEEKDLEDTVLVHELTHALQDQHFDLEKFASDGSLSDAATARTALIEGDATLAMFSYLMEADLAAAPGFGDTLTQWMEDPSALMEGGADLPGTAELAEAPAWFRDTLLFSYFQGFAFCLDVKRLGGQKLLDHAFTTDPPRSSEQILHPEKWHTKRDDPVALAWPDLSGALPGSRKLAEGELGEAGLRTLLRKTGKSFAAAAGWGGDRFAVYERNGVRLLAWITEWDSEADAREFQAAARSLGRDWRAERPDARQPLRVMVLRGALKRPERAAVLAALAAVKAERPGSSEP